MRLWRAIVWRARAARRFTRAERALVPRVWRRACRVWRDLHRAPLDRLSRTTSRRHLASDQTDAVAAERMARVVDLAIPGAVRASCLVKALVLCELLSRRGQDAELVIGVRRAGDRLAAHAWILSDRRVLIGDTAAAAYTPVYQTRTHLINAASHRGPAAWSRARPARRARARLGRHRRPRTGTESSFRAV